MTTPIPPFDFLQIKVRNKFMKLMIVLALLLTAVMLYISRPLTTEAAQAGILSFEFAGNTETAQAVIDSWDARTKLVAAFSLGLDFLYPLIYGAAISLACVWAADRIRPSNSQVAAVGVWLAWGAWLAALLDYIENIALTNMLLGSTVALWPLLAFICATLKFILIIMGIFYVLAAWLIFKANVPQTDA